MGLVEVVVVRDLDGETVGVLGTTTTTLGSLSSPGVLGLGGQGDVVVNELTPGHQQDGDGVVVESLVFVHVAGDNPSGGQGVAGDGGSGGGDTISVVWWEPPVMSVHGSSPVRVLQVVADSLSTSVPLDLTLGSHQEGRAVRLDDSLGGVNQGEAVSDGVLRQSILLGQVACSLVDDSSEVADIDPLELSSHWRQPHPVPGGEEGGVDGLVSDAGVLGVEGGGSASEDLVGVIEERGLGRSWDDESTARGLGVTELS